MGRHINSSLDRIIRDGSVIKSNSLKTPFPNERIFACHRLCNDRFDFKNKIFFARILRPHNKYEINTQSSGKKNMYK